MSVPLRISARATQTLEQPISYFMQQAVENPNIISLAAGLVDAESLPADSTRETIDELLADRATARAALQYGTTQGYLPLREKLLQHVLELDRVSAKDVSLSVDDLVVTTGSQQLLYVLGELLFDPGDIVITEAPSYFVYHSCLTSLGVRTLAVPMDSHGMNTDALEELLLKLEASGDLERVRLIYTIDYFQNPSGLTLTYERRQHLLELVRRFSKGHRIFILEDAAYRELRFSGDDIPSIKSMDTDNSHVILTMTFSKPWAPGLKTGYSVMPSEMVAPLLRIKGNHDFGSSNFNQYIIDRILEKEIYHRHVAHLRQLYRDKRDTLLDALEKEFPRTGPDSPRWTVPDGGMFVWLTMPSNFSTGPKSPFMQSCLREGVLYVPGVFCHVTPPSGLAADNEARLCFGVPSHTQLREAIRRLGKAARDNGIASVNHARDNSVCAAAR